MAKWGEGDPRWIVEDRPDAKNVNNWHWTDKNAATWSRDKFDSLLVGLKVEGEEGSCEITEVNTAKGEASASNRKGKVIVFYDWELSLKWKGVTPDNDKKVKGSIEVPNLSEENSIDEIDVIVKVDEDNVRSQKLKKLMHRLAPDLVREQLQLYITSLRNEFCQGMVLPIKGDSSVVSSLPTSLSRKSPMRQTSNPSSDTKTTVGCKIHTKKVMLTDMFLSTVEELYDTFVTQQMVEAFTRSKAVINPHKGGSFSLLDGQISGEFIELERPAKIVQRWRSSSWPAGHFSTVTLSLKQESDGAKLELLQSGVPESDYERTRDGWRKYILEAIKTTFGFGARLFS